MNEELSFMIVYHLWNRVIYIGNISILFILRNHFDFSIRKVIKEIDGMPFAGGSGSVISLKPMGFIIDDGKSCRVVRLTDEPLDNLIEKASDILRNVTAKQN